MAVTPGTRLGPYEILSPLGAGGMGEVYRARDGRLGRGVAIKILPEAFAADAERLARFRREAQVLASLNHPHIAAIYGLEELDGLETLVFVWNDEIFAVPIQQEPTFAPGEPRSVFKIDRPATSDWGDIYDVSPDAKRFIVLVRQKETNKTPTVVIFVRQ